MILAAHEVLTRDSYHHEQNHHLSDFTGYYIQASAPVAVYAGNGAALLPATVGDSNIPFES